MKGWSRQAGHDRLVTTGTAYGLAVTGNGETRTRVSKCDENEKCAICVTFLVTLDPTPVLQRITDPPRGVLDAGKSFLVGSHRRFSGLPGEARNRFFSGIRVRVGAPRQVDKPGSKWSLNPALELILLVPRPSTACKAKRWTGQVRIDRYAS